MQHASKYILGLALSTLIISASSVLAQYQVFHGYGYGDCTGASAPTQLKRTEFSTTNKIRLSWTDVTFSSCTEGTAALYYEVDIHKLNGDLVQAYTQVTDNSLTIPASVLKTNQAYTYKVRAVAADTQSTTQWSADKKFRTRPAAPATITITKLSDTIIELEWPNVRKSDKLKHYFVVVVKHELTGNIIVYKKKISQISGATTTIEVGVEQNKLHTVKVRSVYSKAIRSAFREKVFTNK